MTTYLLPGVYNAQGAGGIAYGPGGDGRMIVKIDPAALIANGGCTDASGNALAVPVTGFAADDVIQIARAPIGAFVDACEAYVHKVNTAGTTLDIGITGGVTDGFFEDINLQTLASQIDADADYAPGGSTSGLFFTAADAIDALVVTDVFLDGVVTICFRVFKLRGELAAE